jgi:predicted RNase H-like HicB family nuclease
MVKEKLIGLTAIFEEAEEGGYVAYLEEISGVNTQGETLEEARENLVDALKLMLETNRETVEKEIAGRQVIKEKITVEI